MAGEETRINLLSELLSILLVLYDGIYMLLRFSKHAIFLHCAVHITCDIPIVSEPLLRDTAKNARETTFPQDTR